MPETSTRNCCNWWKDWSAARLIESQSPCWVARRRFKALYIWWAETNICLTISENSWGRPTTRNPSTTPSSMNENSSPIFHSFSTRECSGSTSTSGARARRTAGSRLSGKSRHLSSDLSRLAFTMILDGVVICWMLALSCGDNILIILKHMGRTLLAFLFVALTAALSPVILITPEK